MTTTTLFSSAVAPQAIPAASVNLGQSPTKVTFTLTVTGTPGQPVFARANVQGSTDNANFNYANQVFANGIGSASIDLVDHTPEQYFNGWLDSITPGATSTLTMTY